MKIQLLSFSGGADSTAMWLLARERNVDVQPVFADTGHENPITMEYVDYIESQLGKIRRVRADFTQLVAKKRERIAEKWPLILTRDTPGRWVSMLEDAEPDELPPMPATPDDPAKPALWWPWRWEPMKHGISSDHAAEVVEIALSLLHPTGNPFLDLCLWKGRFPSTKARFCSIELKRVPIFQQIVTPALESGHEITTWQGIRREESSARAKLPEWEEDGIPGLYIYRPILDWTKADVFEMHSKHGVDPNPLYKMGMARVGCSPCIHSRKGEIAEWAARFPEEVERVKRWEKLVSMVSRLGLGRDGFSTFFSADKTPGAHQKNPALTVPDIYTVVHWAQQRGQQDMFAKEGGVCSSMYGLCE